MPDSRSHARRVAHQQGQPQPVFLTPRQRAEQVVREWYGIDANTRFDEVSCTLRDRITDAITIAVAEALERWGNHTYDCPRTEKTIAKCDDALCGLDAARRRG